MKKDYLSEYFFYFNSNKYVFNSFKFFYKTSNYVLFLDLNFTSSVFFIFWILHLQCMIYINSYEKYFAFCKLVLLIDKIVISIKFY